jgi:hypothetical protein
MGTVVGNIPKLTYRYLSTTQQHHAIEIPSVNYFQVKENDGTLQYGDYQIIASQDDQVRRNYVDVSELGKSETSSKVGDKVWIRGRVGNVRAKGNACFLVIRSGAFNTIQACHFKEKANPEISKSLMKYAGALPLESIVDIYGEIQSADVKACTQNTVEIKIEKIFTVSRTPAVLPFLLDDAARSQADIDASQSTERPFGSVSQVLFFFFFLFHLN